MNSKTSKRDMLRGGVASILRPVGAQASPESTPADEGRAPLDEGARAERNNSPIFQARGRRGGWKKNRNYVTSFVFDQDQYDELRRLSYEYRLSLKDTLYRLVSLGLAELAKNGDALKSEEFNG